MTVDQALREADSEYVRFWNETLAEKFERFRDILMTGLSHHSDVPLASLELPPGARVLDVGCGWGDTAIRLAGIVGPSGHVLGMDCVEQFLEKGRADIKNSGIDNVSFLAADVETWPFDGEFDFCFSRFGMMFFENPVVAMKNIRTGLKPGAKLMFITWRSIDENPWLGLPKDVVLRFLPEPGDDAETCGPGPFSMASEFVVQAQLEAAGFEFLEARPVDGPVTVGDTLDEAVRFQLALGPAGEVFREAGDEAERRRPEIEAALREALAPYGQDGKIVMPSASWVYTACNPTAA